MPKIIVMNAANEQMSGHALTETQQVLAAKSAWRNAWFADEGDIIVTPVPISQDSLAYIGNTLGFDHTSVLVVCPDPTHNKEIVLTDERLLAAETVNRLKGRINRAEGWEILPCYYTEGVAELESSLGIGEKVAREFAAQRGCDMLNRKSHFRQLAIGVGLPIAEGSVVQGPHQLAKAIRRHLGRTGTVIVKRDNGAAGLGNISITSGVVLPLPGSRETRQMQSDVDGMAAEVWHDLTDENSRVLVVESYHEARHRFYLEYLIRDDRAQIFLNSGTIRLRASPDATSTELDWVGLEIPAKLPSFASASALSACMSFVSLAARLGYRGYVNIDAIISCTDELIFNEVNARWGGGSILHTVAERMLGTHYANTHHLSSVRNIKSPPLSSVSGILRERGLLFTRGSREGVLVLAYDDLLTRTMECLLIGESEVRVRQIEMLLLEAVSDENPE